MSKKTVATPGVAESRTEDVDATSAAQADNAGEGQTATSPEPEVSRPRLVRYVGQRPPVVRVGGSFNVDVEADQQEGA